MTSFSNMVTVSVGDQNYTLVLNDIAEAREFAERLPLTLTMNFGDYSGSVTLNTGITNSGTVTNEYHADKGALVLAGERGLNLSMFNGLVFTSNKAYVTIGNIQNTAGLESFSKQGNIEISFTAQ